MLYSDRLCLHIYLWVYPQLHWRRNALQKNVKTNFTLGFFKYLSVLLKQRLLLRPRTLQDLWNLWIHLDIPGCLIASSSKNQEFMSYFLWALSISQTTVSHHDLRAQHSIRKYFDGLIYSRLSCLSKPIRNRSYEVFILFSRLKIRNILY